jgi:1-deoxy-D-xylulose-5-phosphate reductoisomerase
MRIPIQYSIEFPQRVVTGTPKFTFPRTLNFEQPDIKRFPLLRLAYEVGEAGGLKPTAFNVADEIAVKAFLSSEVRFTDIPLIVQDAVRREYPGELTWDSLTRIDATVREIALEKIAELRRQ